MLIGLLKGIGIVFAIIIAIVVLAIIFSNKTGKVGDLREEIYKRRDSFRNLPMVQKAIDNIFTGSPFNHLPAKIKMTNKGVFIIRFDTAINQYNPVWEQRLFPSDLPSYDYTNGCAIFLLIQERYPNLYDFPNTSITDIENGQVYEINLILKSAKDVVAW